MKRIAEKIVSKVEQKGDYGKGGVGGRRNSRKTLKLPQKELSDGNNRLRLGILKFLEFKIRIFQNRLHKYEAFLNC